MLEGKNVNLRIMEKEDLSLVSEWFNNPEYGGEYEPLEQVTMKELEKWYDGPRPNEEWFIVEKKDKCKIGHIFHIASGRCFSIVYQLPLSCFLHTPVSSSPSNIEIWGMTHFRRGMM